MKKKLTVALLFIFSIGSLTFGFHEHKKTMVATSQVQTLQIQPDNQSELAHIFLRMAHEQSSKAKVQYDSKAAN